MSTLSTPNPVQSRRDDHAAPLAIDNVSKSFGTAHVLRNVSITVRANEVLGLIGENGAGKSTLLKMLSGMHRPDSGQLLIEGSPTILKSPADASAHGIAMVHQEQSLLTNMSVAENLLMGRQSRRDGDGSARGVRYGFYNWRAINRFAQAALDRVGATVDPRTTVASLSFAQRQMVEIAKAVCLAESTSRPPLIILDEPTSVLDDDDVKQLENEIERLRTLGSVIFVSHRLDEVLRVCDRIYVMRAGQVVAERHTDAVDDSELFTLMTGRERIEHQRGTSRSGQPLLQVRNLTGEHYRDVSLTVNRGEVHTLVGVKDSGREELCRTIFGICDWTSGEIDIDGQKVSGRSMRKTAQAGVAYLPSERKAEGVIAGMSIAENLTLTNPGDSAFGPLLRPRKQVEAAKQWIDRLQIRPPDPDADIARLSGGNQQKVVLAKWLVNDGLRLLLLDHPTRGVDPGAREKVYQEVNAALANGVGVLLIADTLEEAISVSDRITVMRDGEISATYDLRDGAPTMAELIGRMV